MVPVSPSTAVERRLYSIVRWFGLIVTTLALALSIIVVFNGLSKLPYHSSSTLEIPSTSYEDFRRIAEARRSDTSPAATDTTLQQKQEAAAAAAAEADFEARLKPHLDAIVANLASYAAKTDQAKPAAQAIGDYIRSNMKQFSGRDDTLAWGYVKGLEKATRDLAADGDRLSKLPGDDARRVRWEAFLDWYTQQYIQQINAELQRINAEREKAISDAAEAPAFFYAGAVAFGVVIIATLLLLLLRIELNTRPLGELRPIADDLHRIEAAERGAHNLDAIGTAILASGAPSGAAE